VKRQFAGWKGIAACCVFLCHYICAFYPGFNWGGVVNVSHLSSIDTFLGQLFISPVMFFINGTFAVVLFMVLSGYFTIFHLLKNKEDFEKKAAQAIIKRYPRLMLPIFISSFFIWIFSKLHLFCNEGFTEIVGYEWLERYYSESLTFIDLLKTSLVSVLLKISSSSFNTVLWMMGYMFWGTFISLLLAFLIRKYERKSIFYIFYIGMFFMCVHIYYAAFVCSAIIIYLKRFQIRANKKMGVLFLLFSLILGSISQFHIPAGFSENIWRRLVVCLYLLAVFLLLYGTVCLEKEEGFQGKLFRFLDDISFSLCLIHMPLICSFSCWLIKAGIARGINYNVAALITLFFTVMLVLTVASLFYWFIERNCNTFIQRFLARLEAKQ